MNLKKRTLAVSNRSLILAIDQGTTGTTVACVDLAGQVITSETRDHRQYYPKAGWVEHDVDEIWKNIVLLIRDVLKKTRAPIAGIALANQGETVLAFDRLDPEGFKTRALVWQDTRSEEWVQAIVRKAKKSRLLEKRLKLLTRRTGLKLDSYFSAPKYRWLLENHPGVQGFTRSPTQRRRLALGTLDTYFLFRLSEGRIFATDASTAARTLLFDIHSQKYSRDLLDFFKIPESLLAPVFPTHHHFGYCALPELRGVPIVASSVDQPAALFGHRALKKGQAKCTLGTGGFLYVNMGNKVPPPIEGVLTTLAWQTNRGPTYAYDAGILTVASAIHWLERLTGESQLKTLSEISEKERSKTDVPVFIPAFQGLGSPHWERGARALISGISLEHTRADLLLGLYRGIAFRIAEILEALQKAGVKIDPLQIDGGLSQSPLFLQTVADLCNRSVSGSDDPDLTVKGIALMGWASLGRSKAKSASKRLFRPRLKSEERQKRLAFYKRALQQVRENARTV